MNKIDCYSSRIFELTQLNLSAQKNIKGGNGASALGGPIAADKTQLQPIPPAKNNLYLYGNVGRQPGQENNDWRLGFEYRREWYN